MDGQYYFLVLVDILFYIHTINCQQFTYNVSSSQLNGWSTIDIECIPEAPTTSYDNERSKAKRSIHGFGALENHVSSMETKFSKDVALKTHHRDSSILHGNKTDNFDTEELLHIYESLINETVSVKTTTSAPLTPILIENANFSTKNSNSHVHFDCPFVLLGKNSFQSDQHRMNLFSEGKLLVQNNWWKQMTNLTILKILFESGFSPPSDCSWLPDSLTTLDLSHSPVLKMELGNCKSSLMHLMLSGSSLNEFSMCLPSLKELDISWNTLGDTGVQLTCDTGANSVKKLKMTNNQLSSWSSCGWPSLVNLNLQMNKLQQLDLTSCPPKHLIHLDLSHNRLKETPKRYPPKLATINLSYNNLKKTTLFHRTIQEVDFSHNSLTFLGKGTFRQAWQLLKLDLSHNKLSVIYARDFHGLYELRSLDLSHNDLRHIRHEAFHPLKRIQSIKLTNNALHKLDTRLLTYLPKTVAFEAFRNPWKCFCHLLAILTKLTRSQCKPDCSKMQQLTCKEGHTEVEAKNVLRQCIEATRDVSEPEASIHYMPDAMNSDEDTSEERHQDDSMHENISYKMMAFAIAIVTLVIPIMGLAMKKVYAKRKSIKEMFNCFEPLNIPSDHEERFQRWSNTRSQFGADSDSETEL